MACNQIMLDVRDFIRQPFAWPGGYPKILVMHDGATLCPDCARKEYREISNATRHALPGGWRAAVVDVHYEGDPIVCDHCGKETESAYGSAEDGN